MAASIRHPRDFWAGVLFLLVGLGAVLLGQDYEFGNARRMGPGFFPVTLGALLALIGAAGLLRAFVREGAPVGRLHWKAIALVLGAVILFGMLLRGAGLAAAVIALVLLAACASPRSRWSGAVPLALGLALFCVILFVKLLGLPLPVIGPWLGGA